MIKRTLLAALLLAIALVSVSHRVALRRAAAQSTIRFTGVNLAGAEFGEQSLPGSYGSDYIYPTQTEVDYFVGKGMNVFRLPFRWERLQRAQYASFDASELARINAFVSYATGKGASVVLDPHNYARYYNQVIGEGVPVDAFADFWIKLANQFKSNDRVIFGLMNEPNSMSTELWRDDANRAIQAIRGTGATNLILVPGNAWTGAHSWTQSWYGTPNAVAMLAITDPINNYAFDVHQYLDGNYSGTSEQCVSTTIGAEKLVEFTNWLRQNSKRGFLGEFGGGRNATCYAALDNMLTYIDANADVWLGWTYWAAGPWWDEYIFTLEPTNCPGSCTDRPQMQPLSGHFAASSPNPTPTPTRAPTPVTPTPTPIAGGSGLRGDYFDNRDFTAFVATRVDPTIDFNWGNGAPAGVPLGAPDTFSVRWSGRVSAIEGGAYTFTTTSDDGVRLWVNNVQIINNWTDHAPTDNSGTIQLAAGQQYDIRLEYYENGGGSVARLAWARPGRSRQIIPPTQLYPAPGGGGTTPTPMPTVTPTPSPAATPTPTSGAPGGSLRVQYRAADTNVTDNQIKPHLRAVNAGSTAVPLSELKIRYWFTADGTQSVNYWCDWAQVGCGNLNANVVKLNSPVNGATHYLEVSFKTSAGTLPAGASTGEIQNRMAKSDWSNFDESNDYSFDSSKSSFADWSRVTLYRNDVLIWGTQP